MATTVNNSITKYKNPKEGTRKTSYRLYLKITEESYDIATNSSHVSYSGWIVGVNTTTTFYGSKMNGTIKQGTKTLASGSATATSSKPVSSANKYVLASGEDDFKHNSDGSLSITLKFTYSSSASHASSGSVTATLKLTTIPRASTIVAIDTDIESSTIISVKKAASNFTTSIAYSFGSLSGTVATKDSDTTIGWTIPSTFYNQIPNSASGECTLTATTYNGDTVVGTSKTTFTCRANYEKCKPVINSSSIVDTNQKSIALTGNSNKLIRYISLPKVSVSASSKNGASIKNYSVTCGDGQSVGTNTSNSSYSVIFDKGVSSNEFNINVTDTRGFTTTLKLTPTIIAYIPLTIKSVFSRVDPTSGKMKLSYSGNYFNGSFGSVSNTLTVRYRYKERGSGTYGNWITITPTKQGNTYSQNDLELSGLFDYKKAYTFEIQALDKVKNSGEIKEEQDVYKGTPVYWWDDVSFNVETDLFLKGNKISIQYEVGDLYITTSSTNPNERFGGTWELYGKGKTLVGYDENDTDFNAIGKTGGSKEMQKHNHTGTTNSTGNHKHLIGGNVDNLASGSSYARPRGYSSGVLETTYDTNTTGNHSHTLNINNAGEGNSGNLQPYIVVYIWRRTA